MSTELTEEKIKEAAAKLRAGTPFMEIHVELSDLCTLPELRQAVIKEVGGRQAFRKLAEASRGNVSVARRVALVAKQIPANVDNVKDIQDALDSLEETKIILQGKLAEASE
jgi:hypothetical protein